MVIRMAVGVDGQQRRRLLCVDLLAAADDRLGVIATPLLSGSLQQAGDQFLASTWKWTTCSSLWPCWARS